MSAGQELTVSGTECRGDNYTFGVEAGVLNSDGDPIVVGVADHAQVSSSGAWTIRMTIPTGTAPGNYSVASTCDLYSESFDYPEVAVTVKAAPKTASISLASSSVRPGATVAVAGAGFAPGEKVEVVLHSNPLVLAVLTASASGTVSARVTIPESVTSGAHTLSLVGLTSGRTTSAALTVLVAADGTSGGGLAATGTQVNTEIEIALALLVAGGGTMFAARRRTAIGIARPVSHRR